jgi:stage II sporulation protein D
VLRRALLFAVAAALASAGAASAYLAGKPPARAAATTTTTTVATTTATTTTLAARTTIVLNGHGWGHGLGMSQWGANGYAQHGWTYDRILAHYYRGTTLGQSPVKRVRVLLLEGAKKIVLGSAGGWRATDAEGTVVELPPGNLKLTSALKVQDEELVGPITFAPGPLSSLTVGAKPYHGSLVVTAGKGKLQVVNALGLEAYVKGVVSSEMPSTWPSEALKAQAVAARSYAVARLTTGRAFDLYSDVRSQVYRGLGAEAGSTNAAVDATSGQVVLYGSQVATTYFFSTSGGRTASSVEAIGRSIPYLVSVPDPYDVASPHHDWGPVLLDAAKVAKQLKVPVSLTDLRTSVGPSGRVLKAAAVTPLGETPFTGPQLRFLLGLSSTWFTVGWLSLAPPAAPLIFGGTGSLAGMARNVGPTVLEFRAVGGLWQTAGAVSPDATGAFSTVVRPQVTTEYRLAAGDVRGAVLRVSVAPQVAATLTAGVATGSIRPAAAGAAVQLQRHDGTAWTTVASAVTDASGAFTVAGDATPGSYRVRVAPGRGLAPGVSQTLFA